MNESERQYLEYRPHLTYSRDLKGLAGAAGLPPAKADNYQLPPELADLADVLPSSIADAALQVAGKAKALLDDLNQGMGDLPGPLSFADYKKARDDGDPEVAAAFEDFHADDMDGTAQGELLPHLADVVGEMDDLLPLLAETFFPQGIDPDNLERLQDGERADVDRLIVQDMQDPTRTDKPALTARAQLLHAAMDQVVGCATFLTAAEAVMKRTLSDQFEGKLKRVVGDLAAAPAAARQGMQKMTELRFRQTAEAGRALRAQRTAYSGRETRRQIWGDVRRMLAVRQQTVTPTLHWLKDIDFRFGANPLTALVAATVDAMEQICREQNEAMLDLYKQNALDQDQRTELLTNVRAKKDTRQVHALLGAVGEQVDADDPQPERQVRRLIDNNGYDKPGTIMTK